MWPLNPLSANPARRSNTIRGLLAANCLSVFDYFVVLALKGSIWHSVSPTGISVFGITGNGKITNWYHSMEKK